jgi:hypothetical protein
VSWHKVTFTWKQGVEKIPEEFDAIIESLYLDAGRPESFGYYRAIEPIENNSYLFLRYFSPIASQCCKKLIDAYHGEPCDRPKQSLPPAVGDEIESL